MSYFDHPDPDSDLTDLDSDEETPEQLPAKLKRKSAPKHKRVPVDPLLPEPNVKQFSLANLNDMIKSGRIDLDPEYQRAVVWEQKQQSYLIDSLHNNCQISNIVFSLTDGRDPTRICIDGKQRLTSIHLYMEGKLPRVDANTGEETYYPAPELLANGHPSGKPIKIIDDAAKHAWDQKQIACSEYPPLPFGLEREIFRRVQMGMPLTCEERLQALGTWRVRFIHAIRKRVFRDGGFSSTCPDDWDIRRGADFAATAAMVYMISKHPAPGTKGPPKDFIPSLTNLTPWLSDDSPSARFSDGEAARIVRAMDVFAYIATHEKHSSIFKNAKRGGTTSKPFGMKEFACSGYFSCVWMPKFSLEQLALALQKVRIDVPSIRKAFFDKLNKERTWLTHVKELPKGPSVEQVVGEMYPWVGLSVFMNEVPCPSTATQVADAATTKSSRSKRKHDEISTSCKSSSSSTATVSTPPVAIEPPKKRVKSSTNTTAAPVAASAALPTPPLSSSRASAASSSAALPEAGPSSRTTAPSTSQPQPKASSSRTTTTRRSTSGVGSKRKCVPDTTSESEADDNDDDDYKTDSSLFVRASNKVKKEDEAEYTPHAIKKRPTSSPSKAGAAGTGAALKKATAAAKSSAKSTAATRVKGKRSTRAAAAAAEQQKQDISPPLPRTGSINAAPGSTGVQPGTKLIDIRIPKHSDSATAPTPSPKVPNITTPNLASGNATPVGNNSPKVGGTVPAYVNAAAGGAAGGAKKPSAQNLQPSLSSNRPRKSSVAGATESGGRGTTKQQPKDSRPTSSSSARPSAPSVPQAPASTNVQAPSNQSRSQQPNPPASTGLQLPSLPPVPAVNLPPRPTAGSSRPTTPIYHAQGLTLTLPSGIPTSVAAAQPMRSSCSPGSGESGRLENLRATMARNQVVAASNGPGQSLQYAAYPPATHAQTASVCDPRPRPNRTPALNIPVSTLNAGSISTATHAAGPTSSTRSCTVDPSLQLDMLQNYTFSHSNVVQSPDSAGPPRYENSLPTPITPSHAAPSLIQTALPPLSHPPPGQPRSTRNEPTRSQRSSFDSGCPSSLPPTLTSSQVPSQRDQNPTQYAQHSRPPQRSDSLGSNSSGSCNQDRRQHPPRPQANPSRRYDSYRPPPPPWERQQGR